MSFIANEISPNTYVNIMAQYYPAHTSYKFEEPSRRISRDEYKIAVNSAKSAGLKNTKLIFNS